MKIKILLMFIVAFGIFASKTFAQSKNEASDEKAESPYDVYKLRFALDADPSPEAVGFDDPKSYWKFSYELRFLENKESVLKKVGYKPFAENPNESQSERSKRIERDNKKYDKAYKKYGIRVAKGKISKVSLLSEENRNINISVPLTDEVKNILAQSNSKNAFPDFWIQIKGKIYSKTKSGLKFKQKVQQAYVCQSKWIIKGKPEWMMNVCGVYISLRNENGEIYSNATSRF
ncbi:MAG: hypothetical protein ACR2N3_14705 [Pyrinomonadaceae bacterium]